MEFKLNRESPFVRKMVREFEKEQMSNEEAIEKLLRLKQTHEDLYMAHHDEAFKDGIKALAIAIRAVGMMTPKPPVYGDDDQDYIRCPQCNYPVATMDEDMRAPHCEQCGQKLKWGE